MYVKPYVGKLLNWFQRQIGTGHLAWAEFKPTSARFQAILGGTLSNFVSGELLLLKRY